MKTYTLRFGSGNPTLLTGLAPTLSLFSVANTGATLIGPTVTEITTGWGLYQFQWGTTTPIVFLADGNTSSITSGRYVTGQLDPADRSDEYGNTLVAIGNTLIFNAPAGMGSSLSALGLTLTAIGNSNISLGITNVALGTSNIALGVTNVALGTTNVAIGITDIAIGTTILAALGGLTFPLNSVIGGPSSIIGDNVTDPNTLYGYLRRNLEITEGQQLFTKASGSWNMLDRTGASLLRTRTIANSVSTVIRS